MTYYGLRISEYRHRGSGCLGAAAPVTGAAADEHNLNVVDCDASVTVPRLSSISVLKWGSFGGTQPQFPWPPPGLLGIFLEGTVGPGA